MSDQLDRLKSALADRYAIEHELGSGGMATVYLAEDLKHHRKVAVKVLRPELAAALGPERFLREIEIAAQLHHPHILPLYDSGEADGFLYYVMPYVEGESLRARLNREKQLPLNDALQIAREVADAIGSAHSHDVVHRDIKPENILLEEGHAVVADFGIARAITAAGGEKLTETGLSLGTPQYMSPEQATGSHVIDGRSDVYSLGCVLYEMLAGEAPFTGPTVESVVRQHLTADAPSVATMRPAVPDETASAIQRALAKAPADRFSTAAKFAEELGRVGTTRAAPAETVSGARRRSRRTVAVAGTAGVLLMGLAWWVFSMLTAGGPRQIESLAVLPLDNLMGDPEQEYFVDGMHDALIAELAQISALTVISRTSVMRYKHTDKSVPEIARELNVQAVVEGSVFRAGDSVRIQAQLIAASPERHLWTHTYDRHLQDVLALHSEVARAIAREIQAELTPQEGSRLARVRPMNPEAYNAYLLGRYFWHRRTGGSLVMAVGHFERAIELDSVFAMAYAGLADSYTLLLGYGNSIVPASEAFARAEAAARRAFAIDSMRAEVRTALAHVLMVGKWDWNGAEREFKQAIAINPSYATGHQWYAENLLAVGRVEAAVAEARKGYEVDPLSPTANAILGLALVVSGKFDEGRQYRQTAFALNRNIWDVAEFALLATAMQLGEPARARAEWQRVAEDLEVSLTPNLQFFADGFAALARDDVREARRLLDDAQQSAPPYDLARLYALLGEGAKALEWLEKSYDTSGYDLLFANVEPVWNGFRSAPEYVALLETMGLR